MAKRKDGKPRKKPSKKPTGKRKDGKPRKPPVPRISKAKFRRAVKGTAGIRKLIAGRLGCTHQTVTKLLTKPGWEDVREVYEEERDKVSDEAEATIRLAINNLTDLNTATHNARWWLSRRRKEEFGDQNKVVLEGGDRAVKVEHSQQELPLEYLDLETRKKVLDALEKRDQDRKKQKGENEDDSGDSEDASEDASGCGVLC